MKRTIAIILFFVLLLGLMPGVVFADENSGGLLRGKTMNLGSSISDNSYGVLANVTDGDIFTTQLLYQSQVIWYSFESPVTIYNIKAWANYDLNVNFYDSNDNIIGTTNTLKYSEELVLTNAINVSKISFSTSVDKKYVFEVDINTTNIIKENPAGLLRGKMINFGNELLTSITDGNNSTWVSFYPGQSMWYSFESPVTINNIKTWADSNLNVNFYDSNDNLIGTANTLKYSEELVLTSATNVSKISFSTPSNNTYVFEFDINTTSTAPQLEPTLNVVIAEESVNVGQEITADIVLEDVANIYAEDFSINYDNNLFDYLGFEEVTGHAVYNQPVDDDGNIRFIVASQGAAYGITGEKTFIKLKFKAKAIGVATVDAVKCRIADTESEYDLVGSACGQDSVIISNQDVNRSGEYTLLDLAIAGFYYGFLASDANPEVYSLEQAGDEIVDDVDLNFIVTQMLLNSNYLPNL